MILRPYNNLLVLFFIFFLYLYLYLYLGGPKNALFKAVFGFRGGHLVSSRGTSGQFAGDIWSVGGGHLVSSQWTSGQFVRRAPKLVREAADTLFKGQKVSF